MTDASDPGASFVHFVHEALGSLAAPAVREEVMQAALRMAAPSELPCDAASFARFVRGPLHAAMLNKLGAELTDCLSAEFEHMLRISTAPARCPGASNTGVNLPKRSASPAPVVGFDSEPNSVRALVPDAEATATIGAVSLNKVPSSGHLRPLEISEECRLPESSERVTSERPRSQDYERGAARVLGMPLESQANRERPCIFVASRSRSFIQGLAQCLASQAVPVEDIMALLRGLTAADSRCVIVVDCRKPSIRPIALAALADELPNGVEVVLWAAGPALRYQLTRLSLRAAAWFNAGPEDDLQAVALRCQALVG